ncbi:MAG: histidine phosphatase family protein [Bacteroidetes bacterium]|nr:histidine phosphatase family protein [Bacteroidota bacterium]
MKELFLIRHAKSDWGTEFLKDVDRPLNERGYSDAYFMSGWFLKNQTVPAKILSSTATRALNTALIFARTFDFNMSNFALEKNIYESSSKNLISIIREQPNDVTSLAVFCHNPAITEVCNALLNDFFIEDVPTCGITGIKFSVNGWQDIAEKKGELGFYQFPKNFKNNN